MFDLAAQMRRLGQTCEIFTGYPRWKMSPDERPSTHSRSSRLLCWRALSRLPFGARTASWERRTFGDFGRFIARRAARMKLDVFDALDGTGLEAGTLVRRQGGVWVCNRGSSHILSQRELVLREHEVWNVPVPRTYFDSWMVDRCLAEYANADAIAVPSRFAARTFLDRGFAPDRVFVRPYGVDLTAYRPQPKLDAKFRVLFAGSVSLRKGIGYLFEAIRPLVERGAVELWLVGPVADEARPLMEHNRDLYTHHGAQPRSRLAWFYSQASVLVLPSIEEGLALVQAQAMACGTPVIATTNTGAEDLFTNGLEGFIVEPGRAQPLRDRIELLLDSRQQLAGMQAATLARVRNLGGWDRYGDLCLDMYRSLAGQGSAMAAPESAA